MASVFISHSSKDDALASDLEAWLRAKEFRAHLFACPHKITVGAKR